METPSLDRRLSVAPMLDWTDRHQRAFMRCLTRRTLLYTEMVVTGALIHGDRARFLDHSPQEQPLALQLGGSTPADLAACTRMAADWGYAEVNLNVGCPSDRVSAGRFGACLMAEPTLVADCLKAMAEAAPIPVTVKHRLGIDDLDSYALLCRFVETVARGSGCTVFIVHARKAWLTGLSPKENREIPPLRHDWVHRLKQDFPELTIVLNGGVKTVAEATGNLTAVDGCMIGRAAYETPAIMAEADPLIFQAPAPAATGKEAVTLYLPYIREQVASGVPVQRITRHLLGLFQGVPGARAWRRHLTLHAPRKGAGVSVVEDALALVRA